MGHYMIDALREYAYRGVVVVRLGHAPDCEEIYADYAGSRSSARREKKNEKERFTHVSFIN